MPLLNTEIADAAVPVVRARGELDLSTAPQLSDAIRGATTGSPPRLLIDLSELTFCDSSGLRAIVRAVRDVEAAGGAAEVVARPGGPLDRLLELLGLREVVHVTASADEALRRLGAD